MAHATISDQDRGPRKVTRCATTGMVFGEQSTPMGWACCADGTGTASDAVGVWLGGTETPIRGAAATFASTTKEHLRVLKMPTAEKEWLPLTRDAGAWNKRMSTKTHKVAAQPKKWTASGKRTTN